MIKSYGFVLLAAAFIFLPFSSCRRKHYSAAYGGPEPSAKKTGLTEKEKTDFAYLFFNASKEKMLGNMDLASNIYLQCIKVDPGNAAPYYELANIFNYKRNRDEALVYAKKAAELGPENYWYQTLYANCLKNKRMFKEASEVYQHLLKNNTYKRELYFDLAETHLYSGKSSEAVKVYERMEEVFGPDEEIIMQKLNIYRQSGDFQNLEKELLGLIKRFPSEAKYHGMLGEYYMDRGMKEKAFQTYTGYLKTDEENPYVRLLLADYYRKTEQYDKSFEEVKRAFRNPDLDIDAKMKMLLSYYEVSAQYPEMKTQAFELCEILVSTHSDNAKSHSIYGDFLYREKKTEQARDEFRKAVKYDRERFVIWNQILVIDSELNDFESMEKESREVIELFPSQPAPYLYNGVANIQLKKFDQAVQVLKEGKDIVVENNPLKSQFYSNLGDAYNRLKKYPESDDAYDKALLLDPENIYVLNNYSYYLSLRKEKLDQAEKMSRKTLDMDPKNISYIDTYGWILYQKGDYEGAKHWLEKAILAGANANPVILEHYGDILFRLGEKEKALQFWNEARQKGQGSENLDRKIADKTLYE